MEANDYLIGLERTESAFPTYYTQGAREKAHQLSEITEKRARIKQLENEAETEKGSKRWRGHKLFFIHQKHTL
jgi:hypothetical protein